MVHCNNGRGKKNSTGRNGTVKNVTGEGDTG